MSHSAAQIDMFSGPKNGIQELGASIAEGVIESYLKGGIAEEILLPWARHHQVCELVSSMTLNERDRLSKIKNRQKQRDELILDISAACDAHIAEFIGWGGK